MRSRYAKALYSTGVLRSACPTMIKINGSMQRLNWYPLFDIMSSKSKVK